MRGNVSRNRCGREQYGEGELGEAEVPRGHVVTGELVDCCFRHPEACGVQRDCPGNKDPGTSHNAESMAVIEA